MSKQLIASVAAAALGATFGVAATHTTRVIEGRAVAAPGAKPLPAAVKMPSINGAYYITYDTDPKDQSYTDEHGKTWPQGVVPHEDGVTVNQDPEQPKPLFFAFRSNCVEVDCDARGVRLDQQSHTTADHRPGKADTDVLHYRNNVWVEDSFIDPLDGYPGCTTTQHWELRAQPNGDLVGTQSTLVKGTGASCNIPLTTITPIKAIRIGDVPPGVLP
jgi:hypothetical protein